MRSPRPRENGNAGAGNFRSRYQEAWRLRPLLCSEPPRKAVEGPPTWHARAERYRLSFPYQSRDQRYQLCYRRLPSSPEKPGLHKAGQWGAPFGLRSDLTSEADADPGLDQHRFREIAARARQPGRAG